MVFGFWKKNRVTPLIVEEAQGSESSFNNEGADAKTPAKTFKWANWLNRVFGRPKSKDEIASQTEEESSCKQQKFSSSHGPKKRTGCWTLECGGSVANLKVTPVSLFRVKEEERPEDQEETNIEAVSPQQTPSPSTVKDPVDEAVSKKVAKLNFFNGPKRRHLNSRDFRKFQELLQHLRVEQIFRLGFPNPAQVCYMNSSLQSLLTLGQFMTDVEKQKEVYSLLPEAELMSHFMNIARLRDQKDPSLKLQALNIFKKVLSFQAPEFMDTQQKDAHEFLTEVLNQIRSLATPLQKAAEVIKRTYRCPVERNLMFKMRNTRRCMRCGSGSFGVEEFTNLSVDLYPGVSVGKMLYDYQKERQVKYRCECGCTTSSLRTTFLTLPRFLMIHLKRFKINAFHYLVKLHNPVNLFPELMVTSSQVRGHYSLISVISHLGRGGDSGHYISDGLLPGEDAGTSVDNWLNYDDSEVNITTGESVCKRRKESAYVLFYQRRAVVEVQPLQPSTPATFITSHWC